MQNTLDFLNNIIDYNSKIIIALSGGPDSMALFHVLLSFKEKYNLTIIGAHVNHHVRCESDLEEKEVKNIVERNKCIFEVKELYFANLNDFENKARIARYNFFEELVKKYNANFLMTAHHGDDLTETILMRLVRGSNIKGYSGFKKITNYPHYKLVRPLIYLTKDDILEYCKKHDIKYFIDKTNLEEEHTRNRYRLNILPNLKKENKLVHLKFLKFSEELAMVDAYLEKMTKFALTSVYDFGKVNLHEFNKLDYIIKKRVTEYILKKEYQDDINCVNDRHTNLIIKICESDKANCTINLPKNRIAVKSYNMLYLDYKKDSISKEYILEKNIEIANKNFIKLDNSNILKSNYLIRLDSKEIKLPLKLRTRKNGDVIEVKNLSGAKKIKDILIDEKIPLKKRNNILLLVDANDLVLWIPGIKKSKFDKNYNEFYDIIYKYEINEEENNEKE